MTYQVYIKSHCEAPDYEQEFSSEDIKNGCVIPWDNEGRCGGKLVKIDNGYKCKTCDQVYTRG